ncbi:hypothetical protein V6N13_029579 [Hibiscus sabdariffa]|uniref:Uncharacterized protein n=2 Tax=Hibiscus sabdariffa TaxID=183260 RepID=A0ABR2T9H8_9ROSI
MEHRSINPSAVSKQKATPEDDDSVEESGWTAYFEDFCNNNQQQNSCGSSLTSNAATTRGHAWKSSPSSHNNHHQIFPEKTRTKEICEEDDSLEDTASSPLSLNSKTEGEAAHTSLGKESANIHIEEENKLNFHDSKNDLIEGCAWFRVPFSMLVNYLG